MCYVHNIISQTVSNHYLLGRARPVPLAQREARVFLIPRAASDSVKDAGCLSIPRKARSFENPEGERLDESDHYVDD